MLTGMAIRMNRRKVLALIASVPAVAAAPAKACIVLPVDAANVERQNARVRQLFEAWWRRDLSGFTSLFTSPLKGDGSPMERGIVEAWQRDGVYRLPRPTRSLFDRFFRDRRTTRSIDNILNTHLGVIVACSEDTGADAIAACSEGGQSHLFFVQMSGLNPASVMHLATGSGGEEDRFVVEIDATA